MDDMPMGGTAAQGGDTGSTGGDMGAGDMGTKCATCGHGDHAAAKCAECDCDMSHKDMPDAGGDMSAGAGDAGSGDMGTPAAQ